MQTINCNALTVIADLYVNLFPCNVDNDITFRRVCMLNNICHEFLGSAIDGQFQVLFHTLTRSDNFTLEFCAIRQLLTNAVDRTLKPKPFQCGRHQLVRDSSSFNNRIL